MILSLQPPAVAADLLGYLGARWGLGGLRYAREPSAVPEGWEAYVYRFQLAADEGLREEWTRPLVLRLYSSERGLPKLRQEFAAQQWAARVGYPAPRPLLIEEGRDPLGGPFMVMEQAAGRTLLDLMLRRPWTIVSGPARMAKEHVRLHALSPEGFSAPAGPFLERHLDEMTGLVKTYDLDGLKPGLDWLKAHRPEPPAALSVLHLDYHPINFMVAQGRCSGVLDWGDSDVGDRHADVGATVVLLRTAPVEIRGPLRWPALWAGRPVILMRYLNPYRRRAGLDRDRLRYFIAWAALRRLCRWGQWLAAGPASTGGKPSSLAHLRPDRVDDLRRCFRRAVGIDVQLGSAPPHPFAGMPGMAECPTRA